MSTPNTTATTAAPNKKLKVTSSSATMATTRSSTDSTSEFELVKEYLLQCPNVKSSSPAIKAAIEGIEREQKRRVRDAKLRSKFVGGVVNTTDDKSKSLRDSSCLNDGDEIVVVENVDDAAPVLVDAPNNSLNNSSSHENDSMEWQDVPQQPKDDLESSGSAIGDSFTLEQGDEKNPDGSCFLGRTLAKACIDAIAEQQQNRHPVSVSTPLAAIAVALHAALRSDALGFACTGVPEEKKPGKSLGFALPVRELPKTEFLPRGWDDIKFGSNNSGGTNPFLRSPAPLRYRKLDTGAVVLTVKGCPSVDDPGTASSSHEDTECQVSFRPTNSKEDSTHQGLKFPLSEHINLDSWNAAALKAGGNSCKIAPSLHYKNLPGLMSKFCRIFDLGAVNNDSMEDDPAFEDRKGKAHAATTLGNSSRMDSKADYLANANAAAKLMSSSVMESRDKGYTVPSTLDQAFPPHPAAAAAARRTDDPLRMPDHHFPGGDFSGDLLPAGLQDPRFGRPGGRLGGSGNLMGPNHPMFARGGPNFPGGLGGRGLPTGGPGTMQPRFDPVMPPGIGGDDFPPGAGRPRGRRNGEPNPDHLPPPNSLGSNMFM